MRLWGLGVQTWSAKQGPGPSRRRRRRRADEHAVARALRGRSGRRADGLHGQPAVRPAARGRRPRRVAGPRPRARPGRPARATAEAGDRAGRPRPGRGRAGRGAVRLRRHRRGHPHRRRAPRHRAGRTGRGQAAHRSQPQRPGGHRPPAVHQARAARPSPAAVLDAAAGAARSGRPRPATPTCRATRTSSGPSRCCWPTTCWPTAGRSPATSTACSTPAPRSTCRRSAPARWPARRCRSIPPAVAADLGFAAVFDNSLDAVSDRDFVAEALFVLTLLGLHLSRIGEEIVLWSTDGVRLRSASTTPTRPAARCCPQKKNPDIAELARGKTGRLIGDLTGLLATLKGLPLAYNRDLQEDKEPLFDARRPGRAWRWRPSTGHAGHRHLRHRRACRRRPTAPTSAATDLAEHLVAAGMPFRDAHAIVGALVRTSLDDGVAAGRAGRRPPAARAPTRSPCSSPASPSAAAPTPGGAGPGPVGRPAGALRRPAVRRPGPAGGPTG